MRPFAVRSLARRLRPAVLAGALAVVLVAPLAAAAFAAPAAATTSRAEAADELRLSVTLSDGVETVASGDAVTYQAEVRNDGDTIDTDIVLEAPDYVSLDEADDAVVEASRATWSLALPHGTTTFELPASIGEIPDDDARVTTLLSVYVGEAAAPVVRTAVANRIAGVDDEPVASAPVPIVAWVAGGAAILLALIAVALLIVMRRRRAAREHAQNDSV